MSQREANSGPPDDKALVARFVAGDDLVQTDLFGTYSPRIKGHLRTHFVSRGSFDDEIAADVLQETFLKAWLCRRSFKAHKGSLGGWLIVVARSIAIDYVRTRRSAPVLMNNMEHFVSTHHDGEQIVTMIPSRIRQLYAFVATLPRKQRLIAEADIAAGGDADTAAIANELGMSRGAIRSNRFEYRRKAREYFGAVALNDSDLRA